jgi:hypothetical protein
VHVEFHPRILPALLRLRPLLAVLFDIHGNVYGPAAVA